MDDVTAMIAGQLLPMDKETTKQFQTLTKKMMEQAGDAQKEEPCVM